MPRCSQFPLCAIAFVGLDGRSVILVSTGLWIDQSPGAESVGGVCLQLTPGRAEWRVDELPAPEFIPPGYGVDLLALFEHPVDTRPASHAKALMLALTDLPPAEGADPKVRGIPWSQRRKRLEEAWWRPEPVSFASPCDIWSRVRRYSPQLETGPDGRLRRLGAPVRETLLVFRRGCREPEVVLDEADRSLAQGQAAELARA